MPKLPEVIPNRQIPQSPRGVVSIRPNLQQGTQELAQGIDSVSRVVIAVDEQRKRAQADWDMSVAETEMLKSHSTSLDAMQGDDYANYVPAYQKSMEAAKGNALKLISDPQARANFGLRADQMIIRGTEQAHEKAFGKESDLGRATVIRNLDAMTEFGANAKSEADRVSALDNMRTTIESARAKGYIDADQAEQMRQKVTHNYLARVFEGMDPVARIAALKNKTGLSAIIPEDMRSDLMSRAVTEMEARANEYKRAQKEQHDAMVDSIFENIHNTKGAFNADTIPLAVYQQLSWREKDSVDEYVKKMSAGAKPETDWAFLSEQRDLAARSPNEFVAQWDQADMRSRLDDSHYDEMDKLRANIIKGDPAAKVKQSGYRTLNDIVDGTLKTLPFKNNATLVEQFKRRVDEDLAALRMREGREDLSPDQVQKVVDDLAIKTHEFHLYDPTTWRGGTHYGFEEPKDLAPAVAPATQSILDEVPKEEADKIREKLLGRGQTADDETVLQIYQSVHGTK